jgi:bacterioferritin-associated ferredoxin
VFICVCHGISDRRLREAVQRGARSFEELQAQTGVSTCCGACEPMARAMVEPPDAAEQARAELSN